MAVGNTFFDVPTCQKVSYHEPGVAPMSPISDQGLSVLDLLLASVGEENDVISSCSDRSGAIGSHHFPVVAAVDVEVVKPMPRQKPTRKRWENLKELHVRNCFLQSAQPSMSTGTDKSIDCRWDAMRKGISEAAETCID